jgi:hypothetical protein
MGSNRSTADTEQVDGDNLEAEAQALVDRFNDAKPSYSPELEWFGMSFDRDTGEQSFVFEAADYIDEDGLAAMRACDRTVQYIEAYDFEGEVNVQIQIRVQGDGPEVAGGEGA